MRIHFLATCMVVSAPLLAGAVLASPKLPTKEAIVDSFVHKVPVSEADASTCDPTATTKDPDSGDIVHVKCDDTAGFHLPLVAGVASAASAGRVGYKVKYSGSRDMYLTFDTNSAALNGYDRAVAQRFAEALNDGRLKAQRFEIGGYTDETGTADLNAKLSQERADAARDYLVQLGVEADRLDAKGYGEVHGPTKNYRANRRVLARVLD